MLPRRTAATNPNFKRIESMATAFAKRSIRPMSVSTATGAEVVTEPTRKQLLRHCFNASIPLIAFGMMDNVVMIIMGDVIDYRLGTVLGIHTLTAAGFGQVIT